MTSESELPDMSLLLERVKELIMEHDETETIDQELHKAITIVVVEIITQLKAKVDLLDLKINQKAH